MRVQKFEHENHGIYKLKLLLSCKMGIELTVVPEIRDRVITGLPTYIHRIPYLPDPFSTASG